MFRWKTAAAVGAVLALALTGCSAGGSTDADSASSAKLTLGLIATATTFEAQAINFANESPYGQAVYDSLLKATPEGEIVREPGHRVGVQRRQHGPHPHPARRRHLHRRHQVQRRGRRAEHPAVPRRHLAEQEPRSLPLPTPRPSTTTTVEITLTQPTPASCIYLTQNAGMQCRAPRVRRPPTSRPTRSARARTSSTPKRPSSASSYEFTKNPDYWDPDSVSTTTPSRSSLHRPDRDAQRPQGWPDQRRKPGRQQRPRRDRSSRLHAEPVRARLDRPDPLRPRRHH